MKYILLFLLAMSFPLIAQNKSDNGKTAIKVQTKEWMNKISSTPEMREAMMAMILAKTKHNNKEMEKLGKAIMENPEMNYIIAGMVHKKTNGEYMLVQTSRMLSDSAKQMEISGYKLNTQK